MAYYLVTAAPRSHLLAKLEGRLGRDEFVALRPFGSALSGSPSRARLLPNGKAMWEEEDYCSPPLAQERQAVLDRYFDGLSVEPRRSPQLRRQAYCGIRFGREGLHMVRGTFEVVR